jgi:hypothetical protein
MVSSTEATPAVTALSLGSTYLDIPDHQDLVMKAYREWQQSNVVDEALKAEFRKACEVTLQSGLDSEQDPGLFVKKEVARWFISDIEG